MVTPSPNTAPPPPVTLAAPQRPTVSGNTVFQMSIRAILTTLVLLVLAFVWWENWGRNYFYGTPTNKVSAAATQTTPQATRPAVPAVNEYPCSSTMSGNSVRCYSNGEYQMRLGNGDLFKYGRCSSSNDERGNVDTCYSIGTTREYTNGYAITKRKFWHTIRNGQKYVLGWTHDI